MLINNAAAIDFDQRPRLLLRHYSASLEAFEMSFSTILVYLAPGAANERTVNIARDLAFRMKSRVIGVASADVSPPTYFLDGREAQSLLESMRAKVQIGLSELRESFVRQMHGTEVEHEWRSDIRRPLDYLCEHSRAADLIVMPAKRGVLTDPFKIAKLDAFLVAAGRPVLVVPDSVEFLDLRHIAIAWKETREARRAVSDALPLLKLAKEVSVVEVLEGPSGSTKPTDRLVDLAAWLARHGVSAHGIALEQGNDPGIRLKQFASDAGAGVIVAGAYGHSRLQEFVLGGVTDDLLRTSKACLLLSN